MKEKQGYAKDIMIIGSTGLRTFVDPKGDLHQVLQNCRNAKIMLLNPFSENTGEPLNPATVKSYENSFRSSWRSLRARRRAIQLLTAEDRRRRERIVSLPGERTLRVIQGGKR